MSKGGSPIIDLKEALKEGRKWLVGAWQAKDSPFHSDQLEVGIIELTKGDVGKFHFHKFSSEAFIVLEGRLEIELEGKRWELGERQAVLIHPGQRHQITGFDPKTEVLLIKAPSLPGDTRPA
jgi:quercetin dioxygenase-like cupin family protein